MENIPDSAVGFLLNNLKDLIEYNVKLITDVDENVEGLLRDIQELQASVKYCTEKNSNDEDYLENLINSIRDIVYEAEDIIEDFIASSARKSKVKDFWKRRSLGKELQKIRPQVQEIYNRKMKDAMDHIKIEQNSYATAPKKKIYTEELEDEVVGIEDEIERVIELINGESEQLEVISITGMLGLGKTTLAKKVLKDLRVDYEFFLCAFVNVSKQYNRKEVFMNILSSCSVVSSTEMANMTEDMIVRKIRNQLKNRKYLIVMDDIWTPHAWNDIKVAFPQDNVRSRIIITTRNNDVATCAKAGIEPHEMRYLKPEESQELLRMKVFGKNSNEKAADETWERMIVQKCGGLPLAIVVIAGILKGFPNRRDSWKRVAESVGNNLATEDESKELIRLSFDHLPYHLKPCFLYLGLFPEDFKIPVWKLLRLWIAEGFVEERRNESLEDTAELYLDKLIDRNLVIVESRRLNGRVKTCIIHDALREFCRNVGMRQHLFHIEKRDSGHRSSVHTRRVCSEFEESNNRKNTRTFFEITEGSIELEAEITSSILKSFKLLRILEVRSVKFKGVPSELYYLVILKYLAVSCDWTTLPEKFSNLRNLQTLIINTSSPTLRVKANLWEMELLRHLHIKASTVLPEAMESTKAKPNLQTLSTISPANCTREMFKKTPNLKKLEIGGKLGTYIKPCTSGGSSLFDNLVALESLETLKLENTDATAGLHFLPDYKMFPSQVTRLTLCNTRLAWTHMSTLGKLEQLEVLKLKTGAFIGHTWELQQDGGGFCHLKVLHIAETDLLNWKAKASNFKELSFLSLKGCKELLSIPSELAEIQSLQMIKVENCTPSAVRCAKEIKENTKKIGFKLDLFPPE